jgi:uncharacterized protein YbaA (DUF1428 family)
MKRRFVIGIDPLNADQEEQFRNYIAKHGAWWHWIGNMWLLTTGEDDISAEKISNFALEVNAKARVVVFEFPEDIDWATSSSANASGKKISEWLVKTWGSETN